MKKVVTVVGARPQFIKASPVTTALRGKVEEIVIHTGQHYDPAMSSIFFSELDMPAPKYNLAIGSAQHGRQTGRMMEAIEEVLLEERPALVLVYGDTNSTLAGTLAAVKLCLPVAHVEAGLRSFDMRMPEELNRVITDRVAKILFCPSQASIANLHAEGIRNGIYDVGDVMADALGAARLRAADASDILTRYELEERSYVLATVHRAANTDDGGRLCAILSALSSVPFPVILPLHPRARQRIDELSLGDEIRGNVRVVDPLGYLDMVRLSSSARVVATDSGGLQKEAYWLGIPCVTLREETEWVETVESGWNTLVGADRDQIAAAILRATHPASRPVLYGDGEAAQRIAKIIEAN
jgi:UDP-N-acetylglucosamine 2-epimerase